MKAKSDRRKLFVRVEEAIAELKPLRHSVWENYRFGITEISIPTPTNCFSYWGPPPGEI